MCLNEFNHQHDQSDQDGGDKYAFTDFVFVQFDKNKKQDKIGEQRNTDNRHDQFCVYEKLHVCFVG